METENRAMRAAVLADFGASETVSAELLAYNENVFNHGAIQFPLQIPLPPEPHIAAWQAYAADAERVGVFAALAARLAQLNFPIRAGISETDAYQAATRRGAPIQDLPEATGLQLQRPQDLELILHPSLAGAVPVIVADDRRDFVALLQALLMRNEPKPVPDALGAMMIAGFNNWDRVRQYRERWQAENPFGDWAAEFQRIIPQRDLYQDRFILLSRGPYSAVTAADLGLDAGEWRRLSLTIRLEHECTHLFTRRVLGAMRNNLLDELIADYRGLVAATGHYRADWFLRFVGLEAFSQFRAGGRLQNYRGEPALSDAAFAVLGALVVAAAENVAQFDHARAVELRGERAQALFVVALTWLTLEELASSRAQPILQETWDRVRRLNGNGSIEIVS